MFDKIAYTVRRGLKDQKAVWTILRSLYMIFFFCSLEEAGEKADTQRYHYMNDALHADCSWER